MLAARLDRLCTEGLLERRLYQTRPDRHEYVLTDKGRELTPALLMLMAWGDRHYPDPGGPPWVAEHVGCGGELEHTVTCRRCGEQPGVDAVALRPEAGR